MPPTKVFTKRFVKDIVIMLIFGSSLFILTHNPITHPKPSTATGTWSIQLMQQPLILGIAGHNYLVLRNDHNAIIRELHGLATDATTGTWKYIGSQDSDILQVFEFTNVQTYVTQKDYAGVSLFTGSKDDAEQLWLQAEMCKEKINALHLPYPPYGVNIHGDTENSNSVSYTLTLCMNLDAKHLGLITPGWGKYLLETKP